MKNENRKILSIFVIMILIAATVAAVITIGINVAEDITEEKIPLNVVILPNKFEGTVPLEISYKSVVTNFEGDVEYNWDLGNGNTTNEKEPSITYEKNGTFVCTLTVTDDDGKIASDSIEILSKINKPPVVTIALNENTIERQFIPILPKIFRFAGNQQQIIDVVAAKDPYFLGEGQIECFAQVDDPEDDEIVSYEWQVNPDSSVTIGGKTLYTSYDFNGTKIKIPDLYTWREGRYVVILTVEDSYGNKANTSIEFQVDKSTTEVMREIKLNNMKGLFVTWNIYGVKLLGALITAKLILNWKFNNFTGVKLAGLFLFKYIFGLGIEDEMITEQVMDFFEDHPRIKESLKNTILDQLDVLEEQRDAEEDPVKKEEIQDKIDNLLTALENLGLINARPIISSPYPLDGAEYIDRNYPRVYVNVSDPEGDNFDIHIYGEYVENLTLTNQSSGLFNASLITPLPGGTEIIWNVEITDNQNRTVDKTYSFTSFWD